MTDSQTIDQLKERFIQCGQGHVFNFFSDLSTEEKAELIEQLIAVDLEELQSQLERLIHGDTEALHQALIVIPSNLHPIWLDRKTGFCRSMGCRSQGGRGRNPSSPSGCLYGSKSRYALGYDGPKGSFVVTPLSGKSLFEVFADKIARASERYAISIPWCIMTSTINHDATVEFFEAKQYFGLAKDSVYFFPQALFPAVDLKGKF